MFAITSVLWFASCTPTIDQGGEDTSGRSFDVRLGLDVLLADSIHLVQNRRVGLITNHTGVDRSGRSLVDRLAEHPTVELVALYAPEHGLRGESQAGAAIESGIDAATGIPILSLYGSTEKPTPDMLEGIDILVFDMQDIGARYYTYVSTMALAMEAAGEIDIPFLVLDRPNPIRGDVVQGNVLDVAYSTFVGKYPVPMRHGMTPAELARMYVGSFGVSVDLRVAPLDGWTRSSGFEETGLPWLPPSPNIPSVESALAYAGTCLFEGTSLSVGRGTGQPFQSVGAPWLDGVTLAATLNDYDIDGAHFEAVRFTPTRAGDGKFEGLEVEGVRLVAEADTYDATKAAVAMLVEMHRMSGDDWTWNVAHFDRLAGTNELRLGIEDGQGIDDLTRGWAEDLASFERLRQPYLLYE